MSEHTLDDLAARLAALGWEKKCGPSACAFVRATDGSNRFDDYHYIEAYQDGRVAIKAPNVSPNFWPGLDTIRQWQAGAEPAPQPPAEPVVTITQAMIDAGANALAGSHMGSNFTDDEIAEIATDAAKACLDAALRGADLAPEGARDGQ